MKEESKKVRELLAKILEEAKTHDEQSRRQKLATLNSLLNPKDPKPCAVIGQDNEKWIFGVKDNGLGLYFKMMRKTDVLTITLVDLYTGKEKIKSVSKKEFIAQRLNQQLIEAPYMTYQTPFGDLIRFNRYDIELFIEFLKNGGGK
jgi:hypothetical protein